MAMTTSLQIYSPSFSNTSVFVRNGAHINKKNYISISFSLKTMRILEIDTLQKFWGFENKICKF